MINESAAGQFILTHTQIHKPSRTPIPLALVSNPGRYRDRPMSQKLLGRLRLSHSGVEWGRGARGGGGEGEGN